MGREKWSNIHHIATSESSDSLAKSAAVCVAISLGNVQWGYKSLIPHFKIWAGKSFSLKIKK